MNKQELAQKINYFKFTLLGLPKPISIESLTNEETAKWLVIKETAKSLVDSFDSNSKLLGLKVPEHRCWCGKEGKYIPEYNYLPKK